MKRINKETCTMLINVLSLIIQILNLAQIEVAYILPVNNYYFITPLQGQYEYYFPSQRINEQEILLSVKTYKNGIKTKKGEITIYDLTKYIIEADVIG